ncbi:hypothetical protein HNY73_004396 [Argiope bruennichi]|uniref:Uncharacterized protein n=1 Tax=Argiope bruennichi TaxID=94029 RepID=A0A8T0FNV0_ARGBR|nr:hypothetical protein HNY73_004396 [Argiope bruennichi]
MATKEVLSQLKRKRKSIRRNITRFSIDINNLIDDISNEDMEYTLNRLTSALKEMKIIDDEMHVLLTDVEYESDIAQIEIYTDDAQRSIFKARKITQNKLSSTINASNNPNRGIDNANLATNLAINSQSIQTAHVAQTYTVFAENPW